MILSILILASYLYISTENSAKAVLIPQSGSVYVNDRLVLEETKITEKDIVETKDNSEALLLIHESILVTVEPKTIIRVDSLLKDDVSITKATGSTWNKFTKLNGVTNYKVKTPNAVATVKGTEFGLDDNGLIVAEGKVDVLSADGSKKVLVEMGSKCSFLKDNSCQVENITEADKFRIITNLKKQIGFLKDVRDLEVQKNEAFLNYLFDRINKNYTLKNFIDDVDKRYISVEKYFENSSIKHKTLEKVSDISKKIEEQIEVIEEYESSVNIPEKIVIK